MENESGIAGPLARVHGLDEVVFGRGTVSWIGELVRRFGSRVLICTDRTISSSGILESATRALEPHTRHIEVFDDVTTDFDTAAVAEPAALARRVDPDLIIGLGGGSCIDMAKLVGTVITFDLPLSELFGEGRVPGPIRPIAAVPTTAGTGSEVSPVAVVTDHVGGQKVGISSRFLVPRIAVIDPALTDSCPPTVTAAAGMDALSHAIEAFIADQRKTLPGSLPAGFFGKNPISDTLALRAIDLIGAHLEMCTRAGSPVARDALSLASLLAGMSFATAGTGLAHALQYPIGHLTHTAHGVGVGFLLPYVMAFAITERRNELRTIASTLNTSVDQPGSGDSAIEAVLRVQALAHRVGLPQNLSEFGLSHGDLANVADRTLRISRLIQNAPRRPERADLLRILDAAWNGDPTALFPSSGPVNRRAH